MKIGTADDTEERGVKPFDHEATKVHEEFGWQKIGGRDAQDSIGSLLL